MGTAHNNAEKGQIADCVIMPGDPVRAKYIADNYFENAVCFNNIRGINGYTGNQKCTCRFQEERQMDYRIW